jgi:ligand-binding sensor domain-containing protein
MTANLTLETCVDRKVRNANKGFSTGGVPCSADTFVQDGSDDMIFSMTEDHKGNIWFATRDHGICTYDGISFTTIGRNEGLDIRGATAILQDETNGFWITTFDNGIWYYDGATCTHFTESNGLVNNAVMSLLKDKDGNVWFGTKWFGLSRYDGKTFTTFSQ